MSRNPQAGVTPISNFGLVPLPAVEHETPKSRVFFDDRPLDLVIAGIVLEGQFRCRHGYLLLTTEDVPYEEGLHMTLVDPAWQVLDQLEASLPFNPGIVKDMAVAGEDELRFEFMGQVWSLAVLPQPRRLPQGAPEPAVHRPWQRLFTARYLKLEKVEAQG